MTVHSFLTQRIKGLFKDAVGWWGAWSPSQSSVGETQAASAQGFLLPAPIPFSPPLRTKGTEVSWEENKTILSLERPEKSWALTFALRWGNRGSYTCGWGWEEVGGKMGTQKLIKTQVLLGVLNMKQFLLADASLSYLGPEWNSKRNS